MEFDRSFDLRSRADAHVGLLRSSKVLKNDTEAERLG